MNNGEKQVMPLFAEGCYVKSEEDYPYEVEATYQLRYCVSSALISIESILSHVEEMVKNLRT